MAATPHSAVDRDGKVVADIPCVTCEYNLRTMHQDAGCPECGTIVRESLLRRLLRQSDPDWHRQLFEGVTYLLAAIAAAVLTTALGAMLPVDWDGSRKFDGFVSDIAIGLYVTCIVLAAIGVWKVTSPDPGLTGVKGRPVSRWLARVFLFLGPFTPYFRTIFIAVQGRGYYLFTEQTWLTMAPMIALGVLALTWYARHLARRIPHPGLVKASRIAFWTLLSLAVCRSGWQYLTTKFNWDLYRMYEQLNPVVGPGGQRQYLNVELYTVHVALMSLTFWGLAALLVFYVGMTIGFWRVIRRHRPARNADPR